jgi:hypothetical protein
LKNLERNGKDLDSKTQHSRSWEADLRYHFQVRRHRLPPSIRWSDIELTVGQRLYNSRVTGKEERQPVSLMLLGAAGQSFVALVGVLLTKIGTDAYLIELIKQVLESTARPLVVKTGKTAF